MCHTIFYVCGRYISYLRQDLMKALLALVIEDAVKLHIESVRSSPLDTVSKVMIVGKRVVYFPVY